MQRVLIDNLDDVFDILSTEVRFIHIINNEDRKTLHQYLETEYPKLNKVSLQCKKLDSNILHTYIQCYDCYYSRVNIDDYHTGYMSNNIDEWRSGDCPRCGAHISFEPNYDNWNKVTRTRKNNIVAYGLFFKGYNKSNHHVPKIISKETISQILMGQYYYKLIIPDTIRCKKEITSYINVQFNK